jgi:hypothetical protein
MDPGARRRRARPAAVEVGLPLEKASGGRRGGDIANEEAERPRQLARTAAGDPTSRCVFPGVPRVNSSPYPMQIVQLPNQVIFLYEYMHNFRVIYTDGRRTPDDWEPSLLGHSFGRWEGDTLVIETKNLTGRTWLDDHGNRHSDALRVTERWTRVSANQLRYEETIDDPKFYTRPWSTSWVMPLAPSDWVIMEYACTDNNKDMDDGLLQPGPLDGSLRDGTAIGQPAPPRVPIR